MKNKALNIKLNSNLDELKPLLTDAKQKADQLQEVLKAIEEFQVKVDLESKDS